MLAKIKLIAGVLAAVAAFAAGAWAARLFYAPEIQKYQEQIAATSLLLGRQNDAVRTWKAAAAEQAKQLAIAEAKQSQIVEKWKTAVQTVTQTVPGPATPCPEVSVWERARYAKLLQAWQPSPP